MTDLRFVSLLVIGSLLTAGCFGSEDNSQHQKECQEEYILENRDCQVGTGESGTNTSISQDNPLHAEFLDLANKSVEDLHILSQIFNVETHPLNRIMDQGIPLEDQFTQLLNTPLPTSAFADYSINWSTFDPSSSSSEAIITSGVYWNGSSEAAQIWNINWMSKSGEWVGVKDGIYSTSSTLQLHKSAPVFTSIQNQQRPLGCNNGHQMWKSLISNRSNCFDINLAPVVNRTLFEELDLRLRNYANEDVFIEVENITESNYNIRFNNPKLELIMHFDSDNRWTKFQLSSARETFAVNYRIPDTDSINTSRIGPEFSINWLESENGTEWNGYVQSESFIPIHNLSLIIYEKHALTWWTISERVQIPFGQNITDDLGTNWAFSASGGDLLSNSTILHIISSNASIVQVQLYDNWSNSILLDPYPKQKSANLTDNQVIWAGTTFEVDMSVPRGGQICWIWSATSSISFDLHSHHGENTTLHIEREGAFEKECFMAPEPYNYSLQWAADSATGADLSYSIWGEEIIQLLT